MEESRHGDLIIDGEVIIGFNQNRKRIEKLLLNE